jgi:O-antigen/teichoic acid export membrane protein
MRRGVVYLTIGLATAAGLNYIFHAMLTRSLALQEYGAYGLLWSMVQIVANCLGTSISIGLVPHLAKQRARKGPVLGMFLQGAKLELVLLAFFAAFGMLLRPMLEARIFEEPFLYTVFLLAVTANGFSFFSRSLAWGTGNMKFYSSLSAVESFVRIPFFIGLGAVWGRVPAAAWSLVFSGLVGLLMNAVYFIKNLEEFRSGTVGPAREAGEPSLSVALLPMLVLNGARLFLMGSGPLFVKLLAPPRAEELAGILVAALLLARVPQYLFEGLSGNLLPNLAKADSLGQSDRFRGLFSTSMAFTAAVVVLELTIYWSLGPAAMRLLWGTEYSISAAEITLLALATSAWVFVELIGPAILARVGSLFLSAIWVLGAVLLTVLMIVLPFGIISRFGTSSVLSSLVVGGLGVVYLFSRSRSRYDQQLSKTWEERRLPEQEDALK